jgi:hypothetical protein
LATPILTKRAPMRKLPPTAWSTGPAGRVPGHDHKPGMSGGCLRSLIPSSAGMIASPTCHGLRDVIGKPAPKRSLGIRAMGLLGGPGTAHAQSIARRLEARPSRTICQDNGAPSSWHALPYAIYDLRFEHPPISATPSPTLAHLPPWSRRGLACAL